MHKFGWILIGLTIHISSFALSGQEYLDKFLLFNQWNKNLPSSPDSAFLAFISNNSPLANKLRGKWLYQLAQRKDWATFNQYYQPSSDIGLQCYEQLGLYQLGKKQDAVSGATKLWLNGDSQPKPCDALFTLLLKQHDIDNKLINQRLTLALEQRNLPLAIYLLKQHTPPRVHDIALLMNLHQNPKRMDHLSLNRVYGEFYLYGLKRLVSISTDKAIHFWELANKKGLLSPTQQQSFLAHLSLYKAMRNDLDTPIWFKKVHPSYYNDTLLGWQIRFSLKYKQWPRVEHLITQAQDKDSPCWQYWLARSLEAQGKKDESKQIYDQIASIRNYYGFLASMRIKKKLSFENELPVHGRKILQIYKPITDQIQIFYSAKNTYEASRLLNNFVSELPKDDQSALAYWIDHDLQWHGKSVYLSNNEQLNNQLSLRFPLAHKKSVLAYAKSYQIPKELIYAIIRQESAFRDDVVSSAGAHGLMQLMPATAKSVSQQEKINYSDKSQLFSTQKNINIGAAYLKQLTKRFHNHPILIVAAYNAGPRQVVYWLKNHPPVEMDIWIETLPWQETRNYLKNVIAFYAVYQFRLQETPDLSPFMKHF
jgi:soluble lytic murein transglycosylase